MKRVLAPLALLALVAPVAATERWIAAYGDSITEGCCDFPRDGGYVERLAPLLGCSYLHSAGPPNTQICAASNPLPGCAVLHAPGTCVLANRGQSNDRATIEGLTRLQNDVLPEWPWDVVILKEGTNDIFNNYSIAAIKAALEAMDEAITDAGGDTVHASIVEFHPFAYDPAQECSPGQAKTWLDPLHTALRPEVIDIANTRNRLFSDQANRVCPDFGNDFHGHARNLCVYNFDFGEKCIVGHPSFAGYDNMANGFLAAFTGIAAPGTPTPTGPSGGICGQPGAYTWNKEANETARWYRVEIDGTVYDQWHQEIDWRPGEIDLCKPDADADNGCALPNPVTLGAGAHSWRLRGRHPGALSPWTAPVGFEVFLSAPAMSGGLGPNGEVFDTTPRYTWTAVASANQYDLEVWNGASWILAGTFDSASCAGSSCTAEPPAPVLTPGGRKFRVTAKNPCGPGSVSGETFFAVLDCASFPDKNLENTTVAGGTVIEKACDKVAAGNLGGGDYVIDGAGADVTFFGGGSVELHEGFEVLQGSFTASTDD